MELTSHGWQLLSVALLLFILLLQQQQIDAAAATKNDTESNVAAKGISVKKERPLSPQSHAEIEAATVTPTKVEAGKPVEINEAPQQQKLNPPQQSAGGENVHSTADEAVVMPVDENVHIERSKTKGDDMDFADSFTPVYYVLVGITSSAILLLIARVYRLRLSRAERKYGVQGDRANQELTPLPMAIEDVNSDEDEDHTLFEVNRQSIRIL
ncbi:uncharacterized protein LOC133845531 [Drosophila sulfurigaster albostrigata]|uniref:uncharacterized protein LOC133845531 n=1 Tax=Drosophila sulfurigaster albostrigata TaxID=89887 RepID=UPI002D21DBF7|nr:uncharacterized protein LOC133845531 [Drosophila sulfurigaster albostrigata]